MRDNEESRQIKAGNRTYFVDLETAKGNSKKYLRITESRLVDGGKDRTRNTIVVFSETAKEFADAISELAAKLDGSKL